MRDGEYLAECGPNTILETSPLIGELVRDLGLEDRRIYSSDQTGNRYIVRDKRPVKLPRITAGISAHTAFLMSRQGPFDGGTLYPARAC